MKQIEVKVSACFSKGEILGENYRQHDPESSEFKELVASVKENGILQFSTVCKVGTKYHTQIGFGRMLAAKAAGLKTVMVNVIEEPLTMAQKITENLIRKDAHPLETAVAINTLTANGKSIDQVAKSLGKKMDYVKNVRSLVTMHPDLKVCFRNGLLNEKTAFLICKEADQTMQGEIAETINENSKVFSLSKAKEYIEREMNNLDNVPFSLADDKLTGGACIECPFYKAGEATLLGTGNDVCMNRSCLSGKLEEWAERNTSLYPSLEVLGRPSKKESYEEESDMVRGWQLAKEKSCSKTSQYVLGVSLSGAGLHKGQVVFACSDGNCPVHKERALLDKKEASEGKAERMREGKRAKNMAAALEWGMDQLELMSMNNEDYIKEMDVVDTYVNKYAIVCLMYGIKNGIRRDIVNEFHLEADDQYPRESEVFNSLSLDNSDFMYKWFIFRKLFHTAFPEDFKELLTSMGINYLGRFNELEAETEEAFVKRAKNKEIREAKEENKIERAMRFIYKAPASAKYSVIDFSKAESIADVLKEMKEVKEVCKFLGAKTNGVKGTSYADRKKLADRIVAKYNEVMTINPYVLPEKEEDMKRFLADLFQMVIDHVTAEDGEYRSLKSWRDEDKVFAANMKMFTFNKMNIIHLNLAMSVRFEHIEKAFDDSRRMVENEDGKPASAEQMVEVLLEHVRPVTVVPGKWVGQETTETSTQDSKS